MLSSSDPKPPFETVSLRDGLKQFFNKIEAPYEKPIGSYQWGVYAFFDYDDEPIYVGQTCEGISKRIGRHLTNQRTDAVAMKVLDPFEVYQVKVWPLVEYQGLTKKKSKEEFAAATQHLNWLEYTIYIDLIQKSEFKAILNEKAPNTVQNKGYSVPTPVYQPIVNKEVFTLRKHPDTRIARRAETLSLLAKVINERQVQPGLRQTLLTQAKRLESLSERRFNDVSKQPKQQIENEDEPDE